MAADRPPTSLMFAAVPHRKYALCRWGKRGQRSRPGAWHPTHAARRGPCRPRRLRGPFGASRARFRTGTRGAHTPGVGSAPPAGRHPRTAPRNGRTTEAAHSPEHLRSTQLRSSSSPSSEQVRDVTLRAITPPVLREEPLERGEAEFDRAALLVETVTLPEDRAMHAPSLAVRIERDPVPRQPPVPPRGLGGSRRGLLRPHTPSHDAPRRADRDASTRRCRPHRAFAAARADATPGESAAAASASWSPSWRIADA